MDTTGLCECGCGQKTRQITCSNKNRGLKRGEYRRFVFGHSNKGEHNPRFNNGKSTDSRRGVVSLFEPNHPRANNGFVYEHILVVEKILNRLFAKRCCCSSCR